MEGSTRVEVARMGDSAFTPRTRCRRAGCIQRCLSGSGGGGWIPLVTRGWPPTSCAGDRQAEERIPKMRQAALVLLRHNGMGFEERKNGRAGEGWDAPPLAVVLLVTWVLPVWGVLRSLFP